ncbi:MAG TPA: hypothetical protein ENN65_03680, partial [Candidatus Hydrogenedentes bacterium]|nr:hypothetical protein [Candidatus Hydrogenedentota bacterium]
MWAKPLADGPIRALFIAPRFTLGDVAQIAARLDIQYETVALWNAHNIGYDPVACPSLPEGGSREQLLGRIEDALNKRLDVIVLGNFDTDILPEELFSDMLDKVAKGTGLVIVHPRNSNDSPLHVVFEALPAVEDILPFWHGVAECSLPGDGLLADVGYIRAHRDGRIVMLQYPGDAPRNHCLIQPPAAALDMDALHEENNYALVARAICVAAKRLDGVRIASLQDIAPAGPQEDEIPPDLYPEFIQAMRDSVVAQPARPFLFTLNRPADRRYAVSAQLRRADSSVLITWNDPDLMSAGATNHRFEIPVGPGAYTLDVWLRAKSGVVDWHSADLVLPGWPEFHGLKLEKTWLLPNDSLEVSLEVRPVANHTREAAVYVRAVDGYGRVVSDTTANVSHKGGTVRLRLHFSDLLSALVRIEAFALEGAPRVFSEWELHSACRETRYVSVRQRPGPTVLDMVAAAPEPREYAAMHYLRQMAEMNVRWLHAPAGEPAIVLAARQQLRLLPQVDNEAVAAARRGRHREPCLMNPAFREKNGEIIRDTTLRHWAGGFGRYSLGNGNCLSPVSPYVCQCRHCLA